MRSRSTSRSSRRPRSRKKERTCERKETPNRNQSSPPYLVRDPGPDEDDSRPEEVGVEVGHFLFFWKGVSKVRREKEEVRVERRGRKSTAANKRICRMGKKSSNLSFFSILSPSNSHPCTHISPQRDHRRQNWVSRRAPTREELPVFCFVSFFGVVSGRARFRSPFSLCSCQR
jgi:hypothetical protein